MTYLKEARARIARLSMDSARPPLPLVSGATLPFHSYHTAFALTENPISEGSVWQNGQATGRDWTNNRTTPGKIFGTQTGNNTNTTIGVTPSKYDDSISVLRGTFAADQYARAVAYSTVAGGDFATEVELLLRFVISTGIARGYEVEFSTNPSFPYFDIVRWNGQAADFTPLIHIDGAAGFVAAGDVVEAKVIGNTIYAYKNGTLITSIVDTTWTDGNPGIGHYLNNRTGTGDVTTYGFTDYTATSVLIPPGLGPVPHMQATQLPPMGW